MLPKLRIDGKIATITLCQPDRANRLTPEDLGELAAHIAEVDRQPDVLVLRIAAEGRYFCSGFDIDQLGDTDSGPDGASRFGATVDALEQARPVTIAAIQGGVYGGATDLALACDFRIGSTQTEMFMPAVRLGVHFYRSGLERYVSRLGLDVAKRLFLTADKLDAAAMAACGFLTDLVAPDELEDALERLSSKLAGMAPIALLGMKKHLNRIAVGRLDADDLQRDIDLARHSADLREGASAWAEKRAPEFVGK